MDLTSGYFQCPIDEESMKYTSFRTYGGCYQWKRLPMGLEAAPAHFQQQMASTVLGPYLYEICEIYLDDVIIYGETEEEFLTNVETILKRFREFNILIDPTKCTFGASKIQYTGHILSEDGLSFDANRVDNVLNFPKPNTQQELKSFLGFVTYFHEHIKNYSIIVAPLHNMLHGYNKKIKRILTWDETTNTALYEITDAIRCCPTLFFIDATSPIFLYTDASDFGIGAYLYQIRDGKECPIQFISKAFKREQLRWDTPEKEAYAIFYALKKLEHLLRDVHFTLKTDHKNLTFLHKTHTGKVERWKMAIQEYDFDMEFIPGQYNIVADILSRIPRLSPNDPIIHELNLLEHDHVIPQDKYKLISKVHNTAVGHHGVDRTINKLQANYPNETKDWQCLRENVKNFIRQCPCCQKMSQLKIPIHAAHFTTATYSIMERVSVDVCGPFPTDDYGNTDILVLIDNFTRYLEIFPMPDKSAKSIAKCLLQWVGRYSAPSQLLSDNGKEFVNEIIKEFTDLIGTEQIFTLAYSKQENAIAERALKEVQRHLRAILFHKNVHYDWSIFLPLVQRILNTEVHSSTGVSPAQLVFGNSIDLDRGLFQPKHISEEKEASLSDWTAKLLNYQSRALTIARQTQSAKDDRHLAAAPDTQLTEYPDNSYVLVEYIDKPPSKLHPRLQGPYRVISHIGSKSSLQNLVMYIIFDSHVSRIRPYLYDAKFDEDPKQHITVAYKQQL